jgi:integrase
VGLYLEKVIGVSPMETIGIRKITSPLPEILFEEECKKLLSATSADSRVYLFALLLLETGMKFEELADLKVNNFDFSNAYAPEVWIKHTGKKIKKDRKLKLPTEIKQVFADYIKEYTRTNSFPFLRGFFGCL